MKALYKKIASTIASLLLCGTGAIAAPMSVRDLKYEITDTAIVFPESQQLDVHNMRRNWYLRNYTVLDTVGTPDIPATDEVIIKRLHSLPTTIEMPFNQVVRSYVDLYVSRRRQLVETMLGLSLYYMPMFEEALEREGLPLELRNLPIIESAMNPNAVSRAGATGLWQFMLPTARGLGMEINTMVDERRDPIVASQCAARYLKQLYGIYNDWGLAIAAYNCGPGNINKALTRAGATADNPKDYWDIYYYLPAETRGYVPGFIGATYAMTYYADHGISPALAKRPILTDTVHVTDRTYFSAISQVLDIPVEELRILNPQYRQDIIPGDVKPYALRLPSQLVYNYLMFADSIRQASQTLSPRAVVEPGGALAASGDGSYREVTKWHKVRSGETLSKIASKYGVTANQIKRWNKLKSSKLRRGAKLKIVTREFVPAPKKQPEATPQVNLDTIASQPADTIAAGAIATQLLDATAAEPADTTAAEPAKVEVKQPAPAAKPRVHKVVKGDTLYSLSKKYGVSIDALKEANGMTSSNISLGQRLTIPSK